MTAVPEGGDELPIFIMGPGPDPERLMLVSRPREGRVRVREWTGHDWASAAQGREALAEEVYGEVERALQRGRRVNQSPFAVRQWLFGR